MGACTQEGAFKAGAVVRTNSTRSSPIRLICCSAACTMDEIVEAAWTADMAVMKNGSHERATSTVVVGWKSSPSVWCRLFRALSFTITMERMTGFISISDQHLAPITSPLDACELLPIGSCEDMGIAHLVLQTHNTVAAYAGTTLYHNLPTNTILSVSAAYHGSTDSLITLSPHTFRDSDSVIQQRRWAHWPLPVA